MEPLYNKASTIKLLKRGLTSPNPSNPERPLWTLADLDKPSPGAQRCIDDANSNLAIFPRGYEGIRFKNLAREATPPSTLDNPPFTLYTSLIFLTKFFAASSYLVCSHKHSTSQFKLL